MSSDSISLHTAYEQRHLYDLTESGKDYADCAHIYLKVGLVMTVVGLLGAAFMLGMATAQGPAAWADRYFWKAMGLPISIVVTGLGCAGVNLYQLHTKLAPEDQAKYVRDRGEMQKLKKLK